RDTRQDAGNAVALAHAEGAQNIPDLIAERAQLPVGHRHSGAVLADPAEGSAITSRVAIDDRMPEIDVRPAFPPQIPPNSGPVERAHGLRIAGLAQLQWHLFFPSGLTSALVRCAAPF